MNIAFRFPKYNLYSGLAHLAGGYCYHEPCIFHPAQGAKERPWGSAMHEAAHAVIAIKRHLQFTYVELGSYTSPYYPDYNSALLGLHGKPGCRKDLDKLQMSELMVDLAGPLAEAVSQKMPKKKFPDPDAVNRRLLRDGESILFDADNIFKSNMKGDDLYSAHSLEKKIALRNNCSFEKVEDDALRYTRKLLVENWKAIWMVAIAMRQRQWLTFEDIYRIISCAEGKVPNNVVAQELARGNEKDRTIILKKWTNAFKEYSIQ